MFASRATTSVHGTLSSALSHSYRIELFGSSECDPTGYGEGAAYLGAQSITTDANGNAPFSQTVSGIFDEVTGFVTATATDVVTGDTSEFSQCGATAPPPPCQPGSYSTTGNEPCTPASAGYYVGTTGATTQTECAAGTYQPNTGQSSCITAPLLSSKTTICNGVYYGSGKDLTVPTGATCTLLAGSQVSHDLKVGQGGTLILMGTWVGHDVSADKAAAVTICGSDIDHDVSVKKTSGAVVIGGGGGCGGNAVGHDLKVEDNGGPVTVSGNTVGQDLSVQKNQPGGVTVSGNDAGHDATCKSNSPQAGSGNTAAGKNSCPI